MSQSKDAAFWQAQYEELRAIDDTLIHALQDMIRFQVRSWFPISSAGSLYAEEAMTKLISKARQDYEAKIESAFKQNRHDCDLSGQIASSDVRHAIWLVKHYEDKGMHHVVQGLKASMTKIADQIQEDGQEDGQDNV
jgi:hypothetical protein